MTATIAVLGAGSWGTALAAHLARCEHSVTLWGRDPAHIRDMRESGCNQKYLPDVQLPDNLGFADDLEASMSAAQVVLVAVPSSQFETTLDAIKPFLMARANERVTLIWACKGFSGTRLLHEIVYAKLNDFCVPAVISGPNFAGELVRGLPTATTVASSSLPLAQRTSALFHNENFRAYASEDMVGVQLAGALKNIYAIATGVSDGLGFGANARAALITRGMAEIRRLAMPMGASADTLPGLAGMGDLVLTCTDDQSRNRRFGLRLGQGESFEVALESIGQVVEGANAVKSALQLAADYRVELPIATEVNAVLYEGRKARDAVRMLLSRAPANEV